MTTDIEKIEKASEYAIEIENTLGSYGGSSLGFLDTESTISANENGKNAFSVMQTILGSFNDALEADKENINILETKFEEYDKLMGKQNKEQ